MKHASIDRLAKARPPHLDPNALPSPVRRNRELAAVFAARDPHAPPVVSKSGSHGVRPRTAVLALAAMTAITAAAVAVAAQSGPAPAPSHAASPQTASPAGNSVLLAAAVVAAKAPTATSRYWVTAAVTNNLCAVTGSDGTYQLSDPAYAVSWADVRANVMHDATRDLGAKPVGKQGKEAWRRSGAPTAWGSPCKDSARDTGWVSSSIKETFPDGTLTDLQRLPTDPAKLRAYLIAKWPKDQRGSAPGMSDQDWEIYTLATQVLTAEPAPPAVRSAAYKVIANLPGVHVAGTVTDPLGRRGVAVYPPRTGIEQNYFVFDPATSQVLADESAVAGHNGTHSGLDLLPIGTVCGWTAYLTPTWTNTAPKPASFRFPELSIKHSTNPVTTPSMSLTIPPSISATPSSVSPPS